MSRLQPRPLVSLALLLALATPALPRGAAAQKAPAVGGVVINRPAAPPLALPGVEPTAAAILEGGALLQFGAESGLLRDYYLRAPGLLNARAGVPPATVARDFLAANAARFGLAAGRLDSDLTLVSEKESPSGTHYRYQQVMNGVPVFRGDLVLKVNRENAVSSVHNRLRVGLPGLDTRPAFGMERAIQLGVAAVKPTGKALGDFSAELNVVETATGARLAWLVSVPVEAPQGDWRVFIDAQSGAVLGLEDRMVYADGTGQVFDPDPKTKLNDNSFVDASDADSAVPFPGAYDSKPLLGITNTAGTYSLSGPYVKVMEIESPTVAPVTTTDPNAFLFQRSASGFEDVNVYFHLDQNQRYLQSLGFTNVNNRVQEVDPHGLSGADNSHYVPSTKRLAFGEGGVDDAEDADVVIHEYGHSIQDNIVPGWGGGQEGAMGEGFGDYWAGTYSTRVNAVFQPNFVFNWDGHNEFWAGRVLVDSTLHYPEDANGEVHDSGTLWCSGITDCQRRLGHTVMDRLVIDHHFALGTSATMADAANQVIQSDIDLYGGAHLSTLVQVLGFWGFVDPQAFIPTITHTPLADTENTAGPWVVTATITSVQPLAPASLRVYWGVGALTDTLLMTPTANPNEYAASIPGPLSDVDVRYYIAAADSSGGLATHPAGAPASYHQFHVGADTQPPVITHTPLADFPLMSWPAALSATVTDNLGVNPDSVKVSWSVNSTPQAAFTLARVGLTNSWTGPFPGVTVAVGDTIHYAISAQDVALVPNVARHPASGTHDFRIIDVRGVILVIDDDEVARQAKETKLVPVDGSKTEMESVTANAQNPGDVGLSATNIAAILNGLGFLATVEPMATTNPATWSNYDLIIHSSGGNTAPVANATYRAALEAWVAAGHKLLVEGGEVVYDAASSPGYATFAANVLHATSWAADNAGTLNLLAAQVGHPITTTPNAVPASLPIAYTAFGSEDSYQAVAPAYIVYAVTTQPTNGGILVYDPTPAPQSAQTVVFGFDFKALSDLATRSKLLENTVVYLLTPEPAPNAGVTGNVHLGVAADHSGTTVTLTPGGFTATTDAAGNYVLSNIYPGSYTLTATHAGYSNGTRPVVCVAAAVTPHQDLLLFPVPEVNYCVSPGLAIPDNNTTGISSVQTPGETFVVQDVQVTLNITHTFRGDLIVELKHGAKTVRLHNRTGSSADNLIGTYPTTLTVSGPGALTDFVGDAANGAWTLVVSDRASQDTGTLVSWCLKLRGAPDTQSGVGGTPTLPQVAQLMQSRPNPVPERGTSIQFALPQAGPVTLTIFDITGRAVRTLVRDERPAGLHAVDWDARDDEGRRVAAGVYLYQLVAGPTRLSQKLVVLR